VLSNSGPISPTLTWPLSKLLGLKHEERGPELFAWNLSKIPASSELLHLLRILSKSFLYVIDRQHGYECFNGSDAVKHSIRIDALVWYLPFSAIKVDDCDS
jgi:hypothetical protein